MHLKIQKSGVIVVYFCGVLLLRNSNTLNFKYLYVLKEKLKYQYYKKTKYILSFVVLNCCSSRHLEKLYNLKYLVSKNSKNDFFS